jgi:uncharacterized protein (DUF3084 family)
MSEEQFVQTLVLLEDLKRQQALLGESIGHANNQLKRLDAIETKQQALHEQQLLFNMFARDAQQHFARLDAFVLETQPRLRTLEAISADTQQRVHKLEDKVERMAAEMKDLSAEMKDLSAEVKDVSAEVKDLSGDSKQRLKRIEMHLPLKGTTRAAAPRPSRTRATKRHKKN